MSETSKRILLVETFALKMPSKQDLRQSIQKANGQFLLTGRLQYANKQNGNGRVYPRAVLQAAIQKYQQRIKLGMSVGQCDHPDSDSISLKNIALLIKQIHWQGDEVVGTILLTSNSIGKDMQALVEDGVSLSISSRGMGSLKRVNNQDEVQDDYQLVGWDLVVQPSTDGATFYNNVKQNQQNINKQKITEQIESKPVIEQSKISLLVNQIYNILGKQRNDTYY